jgi:hypothetical protein
MPISSFLAPSAIAKPGVCTSSTRPASPYEGQVIYETDTDKTLVWNGSAWVFLSTGTANPVGLEYITGGTVTAAASASVNNCFSATYNNYRLIVHEVTRSNAGAAMLLRFRAGGADNSAANYNYASRGLYSTGGSGDYSGNNQTEFNTGTYSDTANTYLEGFTYDIFSPFVSGRTYMLGQSFGYNTASLFRQGGMTQYGTNSFDGFTLYTAVGTQSFKYQVYGYRIA